jgi:hypothetical protein
MAFPSCRKDVSQQASKTVAFDKERYAKQPGAAKPALSISSPAN